jgi:drug/metabolite transporter (DMT)-like permease
MRTNSFGWAGLTAAAALWGWNFSIVRLGINVIEPVLFTFIRFGLAVVVFFSFLWFREKGVAVAYKYLTVFAILGILGFTVFENMLLLATQYTTVANASILCVAPWPFFTMLLAPLFSKESRPARLWSGGCFALTGVIIVIAGGPGGLKLGGGYMLGNLLALSASAVGAVFNAASMRLLNRYSPLRATAWMMLFGVAGMLPLAAYSGGLGTLPRMTGSLLFAIVFNVVAATFLAFLLWNRSMSTTGAAKANFFRYLTPVVSALSGFWMFGEQVTLFQLAGSLIMLSGLILLMKRSRPDLGCVK